MIIAEDILTFRRQALGNKLIFHYTLAIAPAKSLYSSSVNFKYNLKSKLKIYNMKHILLQKALVYKKRKKIIPPMDYTYDFLLGAWQNKTNNSLLITSNDFKAQGTKKLDIETGEDAKGQ